MVIPACHGLTDPFSLGDKPAVTQESVVKRQRGIEDHALAGSLSRGIDVIREKRRKQQREVNGLRVPAGLCCPTGDGLPTWTAADRPIADTDLVAWYVFAHTHVPRPEDWPVMPVAALGFWLRPDGFFERNPALDVPAPLA